MRGYVAAASIVSALRALRPRGFDKQPSTVDDERRAGDEIGACEVEDGLGDVVGRSDPPEHRLGRAPLGLLRLDGDGAGSDSADARLGR